MRSSCVSWRRHIENMLCEHHLRISSCNRIVFNMARGQAGEHTMSHGTQLHPQKEKRKQNPSGSSLLIPFCSFSPVPLPVSHTLRHSIYIYIFHIQYFFYYTLTYLTSFTTVYNSRLMLSFNYERV